MSRKAVNPTLADCFEGLKKDILITTNCHAIGIVQSFDPDAQTVTAKIAYNRVINEAQTDGTYKDVEQEYPLLIDCPAVVLKGGPAFISFPIQPGDTCLILFNDRDIDAWFESGQVKAPNTSRFHSFTDAIALVGISHSLNAIENYDTSRAGIQYNSTRVAVGNGKVLITNSELPTASLGFILNVMLTQMAAATTVSQIAAAAATAQAQLQGLLE